MLQNRRGERRNARPFRSRSRGSSQPPRGRPAAGPASLPPPAGTPQEAARSSALPGDRNELGRLTISIGVSPLSPRFARFERGPGLCSRPRSRTAGGAALVIRSWGNALVLEALSRQNRGLFAVPAERKRSARTGNVSVKGTAVRAVLSFFFSLPAQRGPALPTAHGAFGPRPPARFASGEGRRWNAGSAVPAAPREPRSPHRLANGSGSGPSRPGASPH